MGRHEQRMRTADRCCYCCSDDIKRSAITTSSSYRKPAGPRIRWGRADFLTRFRNAPLSPYIPIPLVPRLRLEHCWTMSNGI